MTRRSALALLLSLVVPLGGCTPMIHTLGVGAEVSTKGTRTGGPYPLGGTLTVVGFAIHEPVTLLALPVTLPLLLGLDALLLPIAIPNIIFNEVTEYDPDDFEDDDPEDREVYSGDTNPDDLWLEPEPQPEAQRATPQEIRERFRRERPFDAPPDIRSR